MSSPDPSFPVPSPGEAEAKAIIAQAISDGATRYIQVCDARIDDFVQRHFSLRGSLQLHRHALGWDMLRVPLNILWSVLRLLLGGLGWLAGLAGLPWLRDCSRRLPHGLQTAMDRQISWLILTDLLQLPHAQGSRRSEHDALLQEILGNPALRQLLDQRLQAFEHPAACPGFQERLQARLAEYGSTRTGSAELASNTALLITSKLSLGQAAFGTLSVGTAVSSVLAHSVAVSNFWLGSTLGAWYYSLVPVAVSTHMVVTVTAAIAVLLALLSTFIGVLTDPLQRLLGLHQRRLRKLVAAIRADLHGDSSAGFALREKYLARLFDVVDALSTVGRIMRS